MKELSLSKRIEKNCLLCKKSFSVFPYRKDIARFCGNICRGKSLKGKHISKSTEIKKGQRLSTQTEFKGNSKSYEAIHEWIRRKYGKASKCEICKTTKKVRFEWSNNDGRYEKDIKTWRQLCQSCHRKHDNEKGISKQVYRRVS